MKKFFSNKKVRIAVIIGLVILLGLLVVLFLLNNEKKNTAEPTQNGQEDIESKPENVRENNGELTVEDLLDTDDSNGSDTSVNTVTPQTGDWDAPDSSAAADASQGDNAGSSAGEDAQAATEPTDSSSDPSQEPGENAEGGYGNMF